MNRTRVPHSREELITMGKNLLKESHDGQTHYMICRSGLQDALAELAKPVFSDDAALELAKPTIPDDAEELILHELVSYTSSGLTNADLARKIYQALLPKPKTKIVWRVDRGPGWVEYATKDEAIGTALQSAERGEVVRLDKQEVPV